MTKKLATLFLLTGLTGLLYTQTYVSPVRELCQPPSPPAQDGDVLLLVPEAEYTETALSVLGTWLGKP
jgi:primosomal protein N'